MILKPWGSEVIVFESGESRVKLLRIKPNQRTSFQYHAQKDEAMMLISGRALLSTGEDFSDMKHGNIYPIPPGVKHRLLGAGKDEAVILEISNGSDKDIVRLSDDYGRTK